MEKNTPEMGEEDETSTEKRGRAGGERECACETLFPPYTEDSRESDTCQLVLHWRLI